MRWNYGSRNERSARNLVVGSCIGIPPLASNQVSSSSRTELVVMAKRVSWIPTSLPSKQRLIYTLPQRSATEKQKGLIRNSNPTRFPNESSPSITAGPKTALIWANPVTLLGWLCGPGKGYGLWTSIWADQPWIESYRKKAAAEEGEEEADRGWWAFQSISNSTTQAGYMQNPMGLTNFSTHWSWYPANVDGLRT